MDVRGWIALLAATGAMSSWAEGANAQDAAEASRRALISEAQRASDHGDHARALEIAGRAATVRMTPSLRLFLAEESAAVRDWVRAYTHATLCGGEVRANPDVPHRSSLISSCARIEHQATPHVAFVIVRAPAGASGLQVRVGGAVLPEALMGFRYPVGAGSIVVEAGTGDGRSFREEVRLGEGEIRELTIVLSAPPSPPPAVASTALGPALPVTPRTLVPPTAPVIVRPPRSASRGWIGPVVLGAGGAVVLGLSGVFGALRSGARDSRDQADVAFDEATALSEHDRFQTYTTLTNITLGVGAACVAGGVVWFVLSRGGSTRDRAVSVVPALAWNGRGASFTLGGVW